jgi:phosphatidylinositol alpha-1,6-mannosyltransferase
MAYILLATDYPPQTGGIQRYHSNLARALQGLGRQVRVIATESPEWQEHDATSPVPIVRVPTAGGKPQIYRRMRDAALRIAGELPAPWRGIIATKWSPEALGAEQAARRLGVPWGVFGHDREFILHAANVVKWALQTYLFRRADLCFAISSYAARNFRRGFAPADRIRMVGCGIESELFHPDEGMAATLRERHGLHGRPVLLTVGRLVPRKGHLTVIQALRQVRGQFPNVAYVIVGEGEFRPQIERGIVEHGLQGTVIMAGRTGEEELCGYYTLAEVMVMPSHDIIGKPTEGFGLTFLEANCCGTPVIGSRTGGIPDAVEDGRSGLLVPPRDPRALAAAIERLLGNPAEAREMGRYGQERARTQFRWELVAQRVDAAFEELCPRPPQ